MKKTILISGLLFLFLCSYTVAQEASLFDYDKGKLEQEFVSLNELDNYVDSNPDITLSEMIEEGIPNDLTLTGGFDFATANMIYEKPLGIGGFWWGCCLGPIGVGVVYLVGEDKEETKKSLIGCVVWALLSGGANGYYWWYY